MEDIYAELLVTVVSGVLVALTAILRNFVKSKTTPAQLSTAGEIARMVVQAAERLGIDFEEVTGPDKYEFAAEQLISLSRKLGLKLSDAQATALIMAALNELRDYQDRAALDAPPTDAEIAAILANVPGIGGAPAPTQEDLYWSDEEREGTTVTFQNPDPDVVQFPTPQERDAED